MSRTAETKPDDRRFEFFGRIKNALKARGRTQTWLEERLADWRGTKSRGGLSNIKKRGIVAIDIEMAEETARLLDVDPCWLVLGRGEMGRYTARDRLSPGEQQIAKSLKTIAMRSPRQEKEDPQTKARTKRTERSDRVSR